MERIREAIKLAKKRHDAGNVTLETEVQSVDRNRTPPSSAPPGIPTFHTNRHHLETMRIIAHRSDNVLVYAFDVLRTKVLQEMDRQRWQTLVVTSPTMGCGKTVTAANLALSIARQPDKSVVLIDLDLRNPRIAYGFGLDLDQDLSSYIRGDVPLEEILAHVDVAGRQLTIVANNSSVKHSAEVINSHSIKSLFDKLKSGASRPIIIVDMPPILGSDDVIAFLPRADCCLLVVAEGTSTAQEIQASEQLLTETNFLGCVLTKSNERADKYYY